MATELKKLQVDELSGVEHPANEAPGWLVMKSDGDREALLKEVDRMESDFAILYSSLKACEQYLGDAPEEVSAAVQGLITYVESLFSDGEQAADTSPDTTPDPGQTEATPVKQTADKNSRSLTELIFGKSADGEDDTVLDVEKDAEETETAGVFDQEADVEKDAEPEAETDDVEKDAEDEDVEKDAEPEADTDDVEKDAVPDTNPEIISILQQIAKNQETQAEDALATRTALESLMDRVAHLEVRKNGLGADVDEQIAKTGVDPLSVAVAGALRGERVTLS